VASLKDASEPVMKSSLNLSLETNGRFVLPLEPAWGRLSGAGVPRLRFRRQSFNLVFSVMPLQIVDRVLKISCAERSRSDQGRGYLWCIVPVVVGLLLVLATRSPKNQGTPSPISVRFTGEISPGMHLNPFGHFVLSNQWSRRLRWSQYAVDAPSERDVGLSASLDSIIRFGTLPSGATTNFTAVIPHTKGVPFRILISYAPEEHALDRLRARFPDPLPVIDRVWPLNRFCTFTSQWFYATADGNRDGILPTEPNAASNSR
jgi:hypothetical protein